VKLVDLGPLFEQVKDDLEDGREPDPAVVALIVEEGPKAVDDWFLMIEEVEGDINTLKAHLDAIKGRLEARKQTKERMEGVILDIMKRHFPKLDKAGNVTGYGIKTALGTYWVRTTTRYEFSGMDPVKNPLFFKFPEPEFKKSEAIRVYKEGVLPDNVSVVESITESVGVRR
jgi:hypothetical protein